MRAHPLKTKKMASNDSQLWSPQIAAQAACGLHNEPISKFDEIFVEMNCASANDVIHRHIMQAFEHAQYINVHQVVLDMAADAMSSSLWWRKAFVVMMFAVCCEPFRQALFEHCSQAKRDVALVRMDMEINAWLRGAYLDRLSEISSIFQPSAPSYEHSASWILAKFRSYALQL